MTESNFAASRFGRRKTTLRLPVTKKQERRIRERRRHKTTEAMRILLLVLCILSMVLRVDAKKTDYFRSMVEVGENDKVNRINDDFYYVEHRGAEAMGTRADEGETYTVTINVETQEPSQFVQSVAVFPSGTTGKSYWANRNGQSTFTVSVPAGEYDVFCMAVDTPTLEEVVVGRDNFLVEGDVEIDLNLEEATAKVYYGIIGPDGEELIRSRNEEPGNCEGATFRTFMHIPDTLPVLEGCGMGYADYSLYVRIDPNLRSFKVGVEHMRFNDNGFYYAAYTIDPTKEEVMTTSDGWQTFEPQFAPNRLSEEWYTYCTEYTDRMSLWPNTMGRYSCGNDFGTAVGIGRAGVTNKIYLWMDPKDDYFKMWPQAVSVGYSQDSAIESMYLEYTPTGLYYSGINDGLNNAYLFDDAGKTRMAEGNPRLKISPEGIVLGNSAPNAMFSFNFAPEMFVPDFKYTFVGRYGEKRNADICDPYSSFSNFLSEEEVEDYFSVPTHDLEVYANDELVVESVRHYNMFSWEDPSLNVDWSKCVGAKMKVILTDNNILVDDMKGLNHTELNYDRGNADDMFPPQLMTIQFRDWNDVIRDRFENAADGVMEFYVGDFDFNDANYKSVSSLRGKPEVKLEYAPFGTEDFEELEAVEAPELFFMPGYGYCMRAPLEGVNRASDNKWYSIRVTLTDEAGNSNVQTITPAFRVENPSSGVAETMRADSEGYEVYSVDGYRVGRFADSDGLRNLAPGLYIVRHGSSSERHLVR